jgi:hypothetical protein
MNRYATATIFAVAVAGAAFALTAHSTHPVATVLTPGDAPLVDVSPGCDQDTISVFADVPADQADMGKTATPSAPTTT